MTSLRPTAFALSFLAVLAISACSPNPDPADPTTSAPASHTTAAGTILAAYNLDTGDNNLGVTVDLGSVTVSELEEESGYLTSAGTMIGIAVTEDIDYVTGGDCTGDWRLCAAELIQGEPTVDDWGIETVVAQTEDRIQVVKNFDGRFLVCLASDGSDLTAVVELCLSARSLVVS